MFGLLSLLLSPSASAFCGFYVGGAGKDLYNDATLTVLMRDGNTTVLSMQNSYQGPPEAFAMVIPVPTVLKKKDVKALPHAVFATIDRLAAPRLVEYWEQDPCDPFPYVDVISNSERSVVEGAGPSFGAGRDLGVKIEAQFEVAEYDIVILSARDSSGLDRWLRQEGYNIPEGAAPVLRPYVEQGTKFFVAKVDPRRVTFVDDRAVLSPLRMAYTSKTFSLPVRLGLLNSKGEQDLLVHILAKNQRYELANLPNVTIPTNLRVQAAVKHDFGAFYEAVFQNTIADHPKAVVTEYSWQSGSCDPCPGPTLQPSDIATLGGDVLGDTNPMAWTLTRLHARYGKTDLDEDLIFTKAEGLVGGRGSPDPKGKFPKEPSTSSTNQFQGRYAILHPWTESTFCENAQRGIWGGPYGTERSSITPAKGRLSQGAPPAEVKLDALLIDALPGAQ